VAFLHLVAASSGHIIVTAWPVPGARALFLAALLLPTVSSTRGRTLQTTLAHLHDVLFNFAALGPPIAMLSCPTVVRRILFVLLPLVAVATVIAILLLASLLARPTSFATTAPVRSRAVQMPRVMVIAIMFKPTVASRTYWPIRLTAVPAVPLAQEPCRTLVSTTASMVSVRFYSVSQVASTAMAIARMAARVLLLAARCRTFLPAIS